MRSALIVGRSAGALAEYAAAWALGHYDFTIVVGKMGEVFPDPIDYWVSFHSNLFDRWAATRAVAGLPQAAHFWGALYKGKPLSAGATGCRPLSYVRSIGGSSGFLAVEGALGELGCNRIVLAGVPMRAEDGHAAEVSAPAEVGQPWNEADAYWTTWEENIDRLRPYVRSMSGRTLEALGAPTAKWLAGGA